MTPAERHRKTPHIRTGFPGLLGALARRAGGAVLGVLALAGLVGVLAPATAAALPEGRVYEMVSPVYKGGFGATSIGAVAPNGESVAFYSPGVFAEATAGFGNTPSFTYLARRGTSGWSTASLLPSDELTPSIYGGNQDVSSTLESTLALGNLGPSFETTNGRIDAAEFLLRSTDSLDSEAAWEVDGRLETPKKKLFKPDYAGGSADLCRLLLQPGSSGAEGSGSLEETLLPAPASTKLTQLYEFNRGCGGEPVSLRFATLNNTGKLISPSCKPDLGVRDYAPNDGVRESEFNAVSAGGREMFFTTSVEKTCGGSHQLFVRLDGTKTLEVSRPLAPACVEVPCGGVAVAAARGSSDFVGASRDGSRVFFTTTAPLVAEDTDEGKDLYMARIGCPSGEGEACEPGETGNMKVTSLVQVSHDPHSGEAAEVQGVVRVAPDGSRVYFVARGVLSEKPNVQGAMPLKGADNLYVYKPDAERGDQFKTVFVADLCSGPGSSGTVEDVRCPADLSSIEHTGQQGDNDTGLWLGSGEAQTAGVDGGFLVFSSYGQLMAGDTDTARDVYRYDAESSVLERVSIGEAGHDANGNNDAFDASIAGGNQDFSVREQYEMNDRAVSEDGSRIVFTTAEPLSPGADDDLANAYEWHQAPGEAGEGRVSLISGGGGEPVSDVVIDPSGENIFFVTSQSLMPQDTDGAPDIYDARMGGGFPPLPAPTAACSGDACQGPLTNPAALLVPGSAVQAPGENLAPPTTNKPAVKKKQKKRKPVKRKAKGRTKRSARGKTTNRGRGR